MKCTLENEHLLVLVIPKEGGRVASLKSRSSGTEFLLQAQPNRPGIHPSMRAAFRDGSCAGIEECLPSVGPCDDATIGGPVPDHGDFWQLPWKLEEPPDPQSILLSATGFSRPLRFTRQISLAGRSLQINYTIENIGDEPTSFLYACHPLLAVEEGDRIILPDEVKTLQLRSSRNQRLGTAGQTVSWPVTQNLDLSRVLAATTGVGDMLYTQRLRHGYCGLYRTSLQQGITLQFDIARLPYIGVWLCYGGWPEGGDELRQYAVALEPTTTPCSTLDEAQQSLQATMLLPGETLRWNILFEISESGVSFEQFKQHPYIRS